MNLQNRIEMLLPTLERLMPKVELLSAHMSPPEYSEGQPISVSVCILRLTQETKSGQQLLKLDTALDGKILVGDPEYATKYLEAVLQLSLEKFYRVYLDGAPEAET